MPHNYFKNISVLFLFLWLVIPFTASSHDAGLYKKRKNKRSNKEATMPAHTLTAYPAAFMSNTLKLGFESRFSQKMSLCLVGSYTAAENSTLYWSKEITEFNIEAQPRFYIGRGSQALNGLFAAPFISYRSARFTSLEDSISNKRLGAEVIKAGYLIGYQKMFPSGLCLNIYAGGGVNSPTGSFRSFEDPFLSYRRGVLPHFGFAIGYAF